MQLIDSASHTGVRALGMLTKGLDGGYHLTAMGTDAIINERIEQHLRNITKREESIATAVAGGMDPDVARAEVASIMAE